VGHSQKGNFKSVWDIHTKVTLSQCGTFTKVTLSQCGTFTQR
jgi:hypothetical protein